MCGHAVSAAVFKINRQPDDIAFYIVQAAFVEYRVELRLFKNVKAYVIR